MSTIKQEKQEEVSKRKVEQEGNLVKEAKQEKFFQEKSKEASEHIYLKPKAIGNKYNEFPTLSVFLHITFLILVAILYNLETDRKPIIWICIFFYIGMQFESMYGEVPSYFKIRPVINDINSVLKQWKEKWIDLTYDISIYHYKSRNIHGQKRRGRIYSGYKEIKFDYLTCEDVTTECSDLLKKNNIYVIDREIIYTYGNDKIQQEFETKIKEGLQTGEKYDKYSDANMIVKFRDIKDDPLQFIYVRRSSFLINSFFFWITSLLLLTIPYRLYVNSKTAHLSYKIHKKIYS